MRRLKILVNLIGLFVFFSFTNIGASEATQNKEVVGEVLTNNDYNKNIFTVDQFREMYEIFKQDEKINSKFSSDMEGLFKASVLPSVDPDMGVWRALDRNSETFAQELSKLQISDSSQINAKSIFYYERPKFLSNGFEERLRGLKFPNNILLFLKEMGEVEKVGCLEKMAQENPNDKENCAIKDVKGECYDIVILNELKKLNLNYNFRMENSKFVCCSDSEEGRDLAKLINFCLYFLRFVEYQAKNLDFVLECLASRGDSLSLEGRYRINNVDNDAREKMEKAKIVE